MVNYGQKISELRKVAGYTQGELGEKLNVTAQAVSKWEKGLSEPDLETINRICNLFNISANEFFETAKEADAPKTEEKAEKQTEKKVIVAFCERCNKEVSHGGYKIYTTTKTTRHGRHHETVSTQHLLCNECYELHQKEVAEKRRIEELNRKKSALASTNSQIKRGFIWGAIALVAALLFFIIYYVSGVKKVGVWHIVGAVVGTYAAGTLVSQCFWTGYVLDIMAFFCRSFRMPGVIFTLDLDGIIALIFVKILLSILSSILSLFIFLFGICVAAVCSIFTFPFALKNMIKTKSNLENSIK